MPHRTKRRELTTLEALILLLILVALGGLILYGPKSAPHFTTVSPTNGYATSL